MQRHKQGKKQGKSSKSYRTQHLKQKLLILKKNKIFDGVGIWHYWKLQNCCFG